MEASANSGKNNICVRINIHNRNNSDYVIKILQFIFSHPFWSPRLFLHKRVYTSVIIVEDVMCKTFENQVIYNNENEK